MAGSHGDFYDDIMKALGEPEFQEGVMRAGRNAQEKVLKILERYPEILEKARRVKEVKMKAAEKLEELVEEAMRNIEANNGKAYFAETAEDARRIVGKIVGSGKTVVMSKSMAAEEVGLREYLESLGNEVWETDLGQFLVQLEEGKPMHTVAPAIHMTREKAAKLVREKLGIEVDPSNIESIVLAVRRFLRDKFIKADVGITGANALAADTGSIVLVENEGNIRMVSSLPQVHIALVPVDKIVPTITDAIDVALVQAAFAGLYPPTYISVITGPSSTGDIELVRVYGAHGPRELHVVFIDNGRMKAGRGPFPFYRNS
ncbi:MAG: LUD domain-containing protein [Desulfurococcales archaeon]|nr:LUD domain-containing protein [Desulfurococcales archaeon]